MNTSKSEKLKELFVLKKWLHQQLDSVDDSISVLQKEIDKESKAQKELEQKPKTSSLFSFFNSTSSFASVDKSPPPPQIQILKTKQKILVEFKNDPTLAQTSIQQSLISFLKQVCPQDKELVVTEDCNCVGVICWSDGRMDASRWQWTTDGKKFFVIVFHSEPNSQISNWDPSLPLNFEKQLKEKGIFQVIHFQANISTIWENARNKESAKNLLNYIT